jgi:hypothetical protein
MIDPASVAPAGRTVRCARCRATWFAEAPNKVDAFVDGVIAEAEAAMDPPAEAPPAQPAFQPELQAAAPAVSDQSPAFAPETAAFAPLPTQAQNDTSAEPPTLADSPPLVPPIEHMPLPESEPAAEDAENFSARRRRMQVKRKKARRSSRWTAAVLLLLAANVALIGARSDVVRFLPQTASLFAAIGLPVNLRQLAFDGVHITRQGQGGATILAIEGKIVSKASKPVEVPRLRFAARNTAGQEIYVWTARPERSILPPGESVDFRSSLAQPPADAVDVVVRFFTAQDVASGS